MSGNGQYGVPGKGPGEINKYGVNLDIDSGNEAIWAYGGPFNFLDVGIEMDILSDDAEDDISGTGAQKIEVVYYLTDNSRVVQVFSTNGGSLPMADDVKIVTRAKVIQSGSGGTNAGRISFVDRDTGGIVYQTIEAGEGQTLSAVQICEKGKSGLVKKHYVTYAKAQSPFSDAIMRLFLRQANGATLTKHVAIISANKLVDDYEYPVGGIKMSPGDIIYWQCLTVGAINTPIEARFDIKLQDL